MEQVTIITSDFVNVMITTSSSGEGPPVERRFKRGITIADFKTKLELVTGASPTTMTLKLYDAKNNFVCDLSDDNCLLGSYPIDDGMRIHVIDRFAFVDDLASSDSSERFKLSKEEYDKKDDTLKAFLLKNKLGKYNEEQMNQKKERLELELAEEARLASSISVGARCEVRVPNKPCRRATVMYNGQLEGTKNGGVWIGVQYDEPMGKNDGSMDGKRYFTCPPKYGGFVKPAYVTVGDFPEENYELDEI